jgi:hypothetical protein
MSVDERLGEEPRSVGERLGKARDWATDKLRGLLPSAVTVRRRLPVAVTVGAIALTAYLHRNEIRSWLNGLKTEVLDLGTNMANSAKDGARQWAEQKDTRGKVETWMNGLLDRALGPRPEAGGLDGQGPGQAAAAGMGEPGGPPLGDHVAAEPVPDGGAPRADERLVGTGAGVREA